MGKKFVHMLVAISILIPLVSESVVVSFAKTDPIPKTVPLSDICCTSGAEGKGHTLYDGKKPEKVGAACLAKVDEDYSATVLFQNGVNVGTALQSEDGVFGSGTDSVGGVVGGVFNAIIGVALSPLNLVNIPSLALRDSVLSGFSSEATGYHSFVNKQFADAVTKIKSLKTEKQWKKFEGKQSGNCTDTNFKVGCLSERLLCSYERYSSVLFEAGLSEKIPTNSFSSMGLEEAFSYQAKRRAALTEEAKLAKEALSMTLGLYNEFVQAWRLHLQYLDVIKGVARVRDWTAYIRKLLTCFPNKFVGVATTECN
jgi:hypothetical protein